MRRFTAMARPRILLVPSITELEWLIKPQLEEWAEVASFDAPGVGAEPRPETLDREAIIRRALAELERCGWDACFIAGDSWGNATAVRAANKWNGKVMGMALGHARLSDRTDGERPPVNRVVWDAMGQLLQSDYSAFVRYGLTQLTQGSIGDELAERMLERIPMDIAHAAFESILSDEGGIQDSLRELDAPLLFAKHEGCLSATEEGFEDALAAFPQARTVSVPEAPTVSADFANALRSFCLDISAHAPIADRRAGGGA
jgi:pimeloyl-ACP methyl ester carboxylesterase